MTPDVNVLVAAFRADHPHHGVARSWFDAQLAACRDGGSLRLLPMAVASFLRLVTSDRVFFTPAPIEQAVAFVDALLSAPGVEFGELGSEWPQLRQMCLDKALAANDIPDAWIAAAVVQQGEHLASFDRDFARLLSKSRWTLLGTASP
jgi:toxin-antitoxin system PIN domain toxin